MRRALLLLSLVACAPEPRVVVVRAESRRAHDREDRRIARENDALRNELRALQTEVDAVRRAAEADARACSAERQQEASTSSELTSRIGDLASTIARLEKVLRMESPAASRRRGSFSKIRLGSVPAQTPTPPGPRPAMDTPSGRQAPTVSDGFEKALTPTPIR